MATEDSQSSRNYWFGKTVTKWLAFYYLHLFLTNVRTGWLFMEVQIKQALDEMIADEWLIDISMCSAYGR